MNSLDDEIRSLNLFKKLLREKIENYSTSLKYDLEIINSEEVTKDYRLINIYRVLIEEKQLLTDYIFLVDEILNILNINDGNIIKKKIQILIRRWARIKYLRCLLSELETL
jgi:hypothetical protein